MERQARVRNGARLLIPCLWVASACGGSTEATQVTFPLFADSSEIATITTDLGYEIELQEARLVVENFQFAIAGEAHDASLWRRLSRPFVGTAWAHPGHFEGGDVTGELQGHFLVEWLPEGGSTLGKAKLLTGQYKSMNFTFARASEDDDLDEKDPLLGHTARLLGIASKDSLSIEFEALIDSPEDRQLIGVPFEEDVGEDTDDRLGFQLDPVDPYEKDTLFDGLDFSALDEDGDGKIMIEEASTEEALIDAYNRLRRTFQTHDHFFVRAKTRK